MGISSASVESAIRADGHGQDMHSCDGCTSTVERHQGQGGVWRHGSDAQSTEERYDQDGIVLHGAPRSASELSMTAVGCHGCPPRPTVEWRTTITLPLASRTTPGAESWRLRFS